MNVVVEIDKGPSQGTKFEIDHRSYRAICRTGSRNATVQLSTDGDLLLDPGDLKRVEAHLHGRPKTAVDDHEKMRIGAFSRGRDILIDDDKMSRTHAMIFVDEHGPSIVDLISTTGTLVNGQRISDADLRDGDIINIGKSRFIIYVR